MQALSLSASSILHVHASYTQIGKGEGEPGMESCSSVAFPAMVWYEHHHAPARALYVTFNTR